MGRNQPAELSAGGAVSLPGSVDRSLEHVAGHEGKDDRVLAQRWVPAVLGEQVEQPLGFPDD
jgi:hypothetical protein